MTRNAVRAACHDSGSVWYVTACVELSFCIEKAPHPRMMKKIDANTINTFAHRYVMKGDVSGAGAESVELWCR